MNLKVILCLNCICYYWHSCQCLNFCYTVFAAASCARIALGCVNAVFANVSVTCCYVVVVSFSADAHLNNCNVALLLLLCMYYPFFVLMTFCYVFVATRESVSSVL